MILEPDTTDLRAGPPIDDHLLALLPLVGAWRGVGTGAIAASGAEFSFGQQVSFGHDGRPFLVYESRTWLIDDAGEPTQLAFRESGFWRPGAGPDDIEAHLAAAAGRAATFIGLAGDNQWELAAAAVGERRLYGLLGSELVYAVEVSGPEGAGFVPHLNAQLRRVP